MRGELAGRTQLADGDNTWGAADAHLPESLGHQQLLDITFDPVIQFEARFRPSRRSPLDLCGVKSVVLSARAERSRICSRLIQASGGPAKQHPNRSESEHVSNIERWNRRLG